MATKSKLTKVRIETDGTAAGTKVLADGVAVPNVTGIRTRINLDEPATATITVALHEGSLDALAEFVPADLAEMWAVGWEGEPPLALFAEEAEARDWLAPRWMGQENRPTVYEMKVIAPQK